MSPSFLQRWKTLLTSILAASLDGKALPKWDATAEVQWHCNHWPPLWYHYFQAQSSLGADIQVYWIRKKVQTCAPGGSRTLDFLHARWARYPLGHLQDGPWVFIRRSVVPIHHKPFPGPLVIQKQLSSFETSSLIGNTFSARKSMAE